MFIALLIAASPHLVPLPPGTIRPMCRNPAPVRVQDARGKPTVHPLGSEPPAKQIKAVVRTVDGCNKPIVVNEKVGAPKR